MGLSVADSLRESEDLLAERADDTFTFPVASRPARCWNATRRNRRNWRPIDRFSRFPGLNFAPSLPSAASGAVVRPVQSRRRRFASGRLAARADRCIHDLTLCRLTAVN